MSCKNYQRLLHLNRTGELSKKESEDLREHLRLCESCSLEYQRIQRADSFIDRLRAYTPTPGNQDNAAADIMRSVRLAFATTSLPNLADRILDVFARPPVRLAASVVIVLILLTFGVQLVTTLNTISDLELRMSALPDQASRAGETTVTAQSKTLQSVAQSKAVQSVAGSLSLTSNDGYFEIPEKSIESVLSMSNLSIASTAVNSSTLHLDRKTLERIIVEIKSTAGRTFRPGR